MRRDIDIKNINKDYLVTVNAKTAAMKAPGGMKFFITDVRTCNIFFKLEFDKPASDLTGYRIPKEKASDYVLTLRIVKPNNETKEVTAELIEEDREFFVVDLPSYCTDTIGTYTCELFIDAMVTLEPEEEPPVEEPPIEEETPEGEEGIEPLQEPEEEPEPIKYPERSTTESFTYNIVESIFNSVDEIIEDVSKYPLIDSLATKEYVNETVEHMDLFGYATRDYVNQVAIGGEIDLSEYVKEEELSKALENLLDYSDITLDKYVTNDEFADVIAKLPSHDDIKDYVTEADLAKALVDITFNGEIDLSGYATQRDLSSKSDIGHTHKEYVTDIVLRSKDYATKKDIPKELPANGGNAATVSGFGIWVGTIGEYHTIANIDEHTLYFIKEDE